MFALSILKGFAEAYKFVMLDSKQAEQINNRKKTAEKEMAK